MKKSIFLQALMAFVVLFFVACSPPAVVGGCLPPPVTTVPAVMGKARTQGERPIDPGGIPAWWNVQPNRFLPYKLMPEDKVSSRVNDIVIKDNDVWIALSHNILHYSPATGNAHSYLVLDDDSVVWIIRDILLTTEGELWALVTLAKQERTALAHYIAQTDRFELVSFSEDIRKPQRNSKQDYIFFIDSQAMAETPDGNILMPFGKNIVSYNPHTKLARRLLPDDFSFYISAIVVHQNKAWFTVGNIEPAPAKQPDYRQDMDLRSVDLQNGKLVNYGHAPSILDEKTWYWYMKTSYRPIAVDKLGRIWMGYFARLVSGKDGQYTWEKITYPPEFVVAYDPDIRYMWASVETVYRSFDGNLWFFTSAGLVEYNVDQAKWCMSMPLRMPLAVADDGKGHLWMAIQDRSGGAYLYKYDLVP